MSATLFLGFGGSTAGLLVGRVWVTYIWPWWNFKFIDVVKVKNNDFHWRTHGKIFSFLLFFFSFKFLNIESWKIYTSNINKIFEIQISYIQVQLKGEEHLKNKIFLKDKIKILMHLFLKKQENEGEYKIKLKWKG